MIDPEVRIPLTWPQGTYGLPMTYRGCPVGAGFRWHHGYRHQEGELGNSWSGGYHLGGKKSIWTNEQTFCMKTQQRGTEYDLEWGPGQYCIFKKGDCQEGKPYKLLERSRGTERQTSGGFKLRTPQIENEQGKTVPNNQFLWIKLA